MNSVPPIKDQSSEGSLFDSQSLASLSVTITLGTYRRHVDDGPKNFFCGHRVSARLDQNVEHVAVLVDRAPQLPLCAVDLDEHLIQVPFVARPPTTTAQLVRVVLPEPVAPGPDRLIGHVDTAFEHQLLHVAEAQREPVVQGR